MSLHQPKISYISIQENFFKLEDELYKIIKGTIQEAKPIRKRFQDGKLTCYSYDNHRGKNGTYCAFCKDRFKCHQKIRLNLVIMKGKQHICAVLDINKPSFKYLEEIIKNIGQCNLQYTVVYMKIKYDEERKVKYIDFTR